MPLYAVVNGENPGPVQHPAITLVEPNGSSYNPATSPLGWDIVTNGVSTSNNAPRIWDTANRAYFWRLIGAATVSNVILRVSTQSGNISLALYRNSGSGRSSIPGARLATTGAIACPAAGDATVALGSSVALEPGDWIGMSCDNNVASFMGATVGIALGAIYAGMGGYQAAAHPCPATPAFTAAGMPAAVVLVCAS